MIFINGQARRNLQEQVGYNAEQIDKIWEFLDGLNVSDNVILLASGSGTLTAEELEIVKREVSFIIYNNNLYIKTSKSASTLTFKQVALNVSDQGTYNILQSFKIEVTLSNGAYAYASNTILSLYNKSEMDTLLGNKADTSYVNTELAKKANLTGANFSGAITSPSIIENMSGYSTSISTADLAWTPIYAGACKNGNKITFVVFGSFTKDSSTRNTANVCILTIPDAVGNKLYPYEVDSYNVLEHKKIYATSNSALSSIGEIVSALIKANNYTLYLRLEGMASLADGTYFFRHESTFLLSDNLAS